MLRYYLLTLFILVGSLHGENLSYQFEKWENKKTALESLFLQANPLSITVGGFSHDALDSLTEKEASDVNLLQVDLQGLDLDKLRKVFPFFTKLQVIKVEANYFPIQDESEMFTVMRGFLEEKGFRPIANWYKKGEQRYAIFVKNTFFGQDPKAHEKDINIKEYHVCRVNEMNAYFYVDNIPDGIKWHLRQGIYWESGIGNLIKQYTKPGTVAVDIGAHIGIHTITMSRKVGPTGAVIAFEPQKKMYAEQQYNLAVNQCYNVISLRKALGDTFDTIELSERNPLNEGGTPLGKGGDFAQMITLDSLNLHNVSMIKMDVERFEYYVFLGAKETILRNKPVIIFEIMGGDDYHNCTADVRYKFDRVIKLVESFGYKVQLIFGNDYIALPL